MKKPPQKKDVALEAAVQHHRGGRLAEAEEAYRKILRLRPNHLTALANLGVILRGRGAYADARSLYERVLAINPQDGLTWSNLASLNIAEGRQEEAVAAAQHATQYAPQLATAHDNLGYALFLVNRFEAAEEALLKSVTLDPKSANAWNNLGQVYQRQGRLAEAAAAYQHAVSLAPTFSLPFSNLLFCMHFGSQWSTEQIHAAHVEWGQRFDTAPKYVSSATFNRNDKPRIALVSADLFHHPVSVFLKPLIAHWPYDQFELGFFASVKRADDTTAWYRDQADYWQDIAADSDALAARKIADWQADVLIDLGGHTGGSRIRVLSHRPAPVQISWLGYFDTTGMKSVDYLIADPVCVPPALDRFFTEKVLRLPDDFVCFAPPAGVSEPGPLPALANGYVTFGSQNQLAKVTDEVIALWARVLQAHPTARFLFQAKPFGDAGTVEIYAKKFASHGIDPARIEFQPALPQTAILDNYRRIDLALDPFPCAGGTTTCEALWMGVPVVTLIGDRFGGRHSASHLSNVGLPQFIAHDKNQYLAIVDRCASTLEGLAMVRANLRAHMRQSPLCDGIRFARNFAALLTQVINQ